MSITIANATIPGSATSASSATSAASLTPVADAIYFVNVVAERAAGTPNTPTFSGAGLTWAQVATDANGSTPMRGTVFRAQATGSETPGQLTADFGGQTQDGIAFTTTKVTGMALGSNGATAVVQAPHSNGNSGTASVNLASFADAVNNACLVFTGIASSATITVGSGFTVLANLAASTFARSHNEYKIGEDTTADCTFASTSWAITAVELQVASGILKPAVIGHHIYNG